MKRTIYGLSYSVIAIISFLFALIDNFLPIIALLFFVIVVEKDKWLVRQVTSAFLLKSVYALVLSVCNTFSSNFIATSISSSGLAETSKFGRFIYLILYIAYLLIVLISILHVKIGKEANVPIIAQLFYEKTAEDLSDRFQEEPPKRAPRIHHFFEDIATSIQVSEEDSNNDK